MVLDEIDKLSMSYQGDPAAALLEVLDPEQNNSFTDHYLNVPYDLSDVLFICTANSLDTIPEPLLNRMEVIPFTGYMETEKYHIAVRHLLPKALESAGITSGQIFVPEETMHAIIADYTMEAGVRGLKQKLDSLCRSAAVRFIEGDSEKLLIGTEELKEYLGRKPVRHELTPESSRPGVVTGLAWTQAGGDILYIETLFTKGSGKVTITGQLGDVMKESVQIAISLVKSLFPEKAGLFEENDLHVHVPAGAVPKDGPSAGITLT
ncbi:MAG: AAA family ATPase, partial [Lachnospiraceae bacterium]|nr:AAA family ATPase [Lachnospiraceae bacterium]